MSESLGGPGVLLIDGKEHLCEFHLDQYVEGNMITGSGFVVATEETLRAAFGDKRHIRMADGRTFPIIITRLGHGDRDAPFRLAGAIMSPAR